mgnify:CR=1 FL=1
MSSNIAQTPIDIPNPKNIINNPTPLDNLNNNLYGDLNTNHLSMENIESNSFHLVKIVSLCILIILLLYNIYLYINNEETLLDKILKFLNIHNNDDDKKENEIEKKPLIKGSNKKKCKKKKNEDNFMDVKNLALIEKYKKLPESELNKALQIQDSDKPENKPIPSPDLSSESDIQKAKKTGYCFVGEDRTGRKCVSINASDKCMSGEIYPSMGICINPNLRAN